MYNEAMNKLPFALMLTVATCCYGQNANTGTYPAIHPIQIVSSDTDAVKIEQTAPLTTDEVFAVVDLFKLGVTIPLKLASISDSIGDSFGFFCGCQSLYVFVTTPMKRGENIITVQNANAVCVVELPNLSPVGSAFCGGRGSTASIDASSDPSPTIALWVVHMAYGNPVPVEGVLASMMGGKCVIGVSNISPGPYTIQVPVISTNLVQGWHMAQITFENNERR